MSTKYERALQLWGAAKLEEAHSYGYTGRKPKSFDLDTETVEVKLDFDQGYACCGGRDPDCYCSFAESPRCQVSISGYSPSGDQYWTSIDHDTFDFARMMREMAEIDV